MARIWHCITSLQRIGYSKMPNSYNWMISSSQRTMTISVLIASLQETFESISLLACTVSGNELASRRLALVMSGRVFEIRNKFGSIWNLRWIWYDVFFHMIWLGARRYLLNEKDENLPRARRNYKRFRVICFSSFSKWFIIYLVLLPISDLQLLTTRWSHCGTHFYFTWFSLNTIYWRNFGNGLNLIIEIFK